MAQDYHWWRADALCPQVGTDVFFPDDNETGHLARRVCDLCPVRLPCLVESLVNQDEYGIFGGFGKTHRRPLSALIEQGHNPIDVAREAIRKDRHDRHDAADHGGGDLPGGDLCRLRPAARRRAQERARLAALRDGAA